MIFFKQEKKFVNTILYIRNTITADVEQIKKYVKGIYEENAVL